MFFFIFYPSSNSNDALLQKEQDVFMTQMPPIMANSKEGQDHKDKYFHTSKKILSQEMDHVQYGNSYVLFFLEIITNVFFFKWSNVKVKMLSTSTKIFSQAIFM